MAFTDTSAVSNQVQTGYDLVADFALRKEAIFDQFSTTKTASTNEGDSITFHRWTEIAEQASTIGETTDVVPVALASTKFVVTPEEYGMTTVTSAKVRSDTMLPSFSADQVNLVAYNMAISLDTVARAAIDLGTVERFIGQATEGAILATNILTADEVRQEHAAIVDANVMPLGGHYAWLISPTVSYDLKSETGDGAWVAPAQYVNTEKIYQNEIGVFAGFKFVETNRVTLNVDGGDTNVDVYSNYIFGAESMAKAVSTPPKIVQGPVTDYLLRLVPLGWYAYLGYGPFRAEANRRVLCASSIGDN